MIEIRNEATHWQGLPLHRLEWISEIGLGGDVLRKVTRKLAKSSKDPPVLICSIITDPDVVEAARQAGALAYVFKTRIEQDLILASKSVLQGRALSITSFTLNDLILQIIRLPLETSLSD